MRAGSSLLLLAIALTSACGGSSTERFFAGRPAGTDVAIGALVTGSDVLLYSCGGPATMSTHTKWFDLKMSGSALSGDNGGTMVSANLTGGKLEGWLEVPGNPRLNFALGESGMTGTRGLYDSVDSGCRTGLIMLDDSSAQGVFCDSHGLFDEVTPVAPIAITDKGLAVSTKTSGTQLFLHRL
ncbi:MAG: hypothetical protein U1E65_17035 [Myxococcota bacterium]